MGEVVLVEVGDWIRFRWQGKIIIEEIIYLSKTKYSGELTAVTNVGDILYGDILENRKKWNASRTHSQTQTT